MFDRFLKTSLQFSCFLEKSCPKINENYYLPKRIQTKVTTFSPSSYNKKIHWPQVDLERAKFK